MLKPAHAIFEDLVHWRRDFHMHPELGFRETRTAEIVAQELEKLGYRVRRGVGRTGVVADIGDGNGRTIAIRADMDALPILESQDREYASQNSGVMHACGHDSHTSMALGAAALLAKEKFPGRVRFLFQPSEETEDEEGISGAPRMIQDGALEGVHGVFRCVRLIAAVRGRRGQTVVRTGRGAAVSVATARSTASRGAQPSPRSASVPVARRAGALR